MRPVDNHGKGESFSPTDLVATALGTCMATVMGIFAERHDDRSARDEGHGGQGNGADARAPHRPADVRDRVPLPATHPQREALERAALTCPVHQSLHPEVEKPVTFRSGPEWISPPR